MAGLTPVTLSLSIHRRLSTEFSVHVDLAVDRGITILFGASGSGKTTILRCLAGLTTPDEGRVAIGDRVLFDAAHGVCVPPQQRRVGYVFQHLALFPHLTVAANIEYGLADLGHTVKQGRVRAIAESFQIAHILGRTPPETSGGERQRTALARALVTGPDLLLLDEPLSALDHATQSRIMADLRAWNAARAIPILYVTHAHREVFALGERVVVLDAGRVIADGTPQEVMADPVNEGIAQIAGFENVLDATVTALRPDVGTMECRLSGGTTEMEVPLSSAHPGDAVRVAIRAGDILVATEPPRGLSARNVLPGRIIGIRLEGTTVILSVDAGGLFEVHVTPGARSALGLEATRRVWLVIKTHSCRLVA